MKNINQLYEVYNEFLDRENLEEVSLEEFNKSDVISICYTKINSDSYEYDLEIKYDIYKETLISNVYNDFIDIELKEKESINTMIYNLESCSFDDFVNDVNIDFDELDKLMELKMNKLKRKYA
ncbi:hypothetical protein SAMN02745120_0146 [Acetoanaerobium noterae]|uniref:Uncharacterized protein n=1 Tax=Acetoanaerobium noterae TaxID=745369 RepID=A0A1T5DTT4_9FIRM|nr:hypothetical protein [Acetoanaerobium noterae]SKB75168.1 hypothetical protein SAMN02745120_0146 [Acetoanaerobium noterae]